MAARPADEGFLTSARITELRLDPVQGTFDAAHLSEVHRRIFQDLPHHAPGTFRPDAAGHHKARELETSGRRHVVGYVRGREIGERLDRVLGELRGGEALRGLDPDDFAQGMARLYGDLDHIHPFREGNSRTLREFTYQLAGEAGYRLDWMQTGADAQARDRLYLARDREVLERLYPGLDEARAMETESRTEYEAFFTLGYLRKHDALVTIVREQLSTLTALHEQEVTAPDLKGLNLEAFSSAAAGRLAVAVQVSDLSPTDVRLAAQELANEAGRHVNLGGITEARLAHDMEAARQGHGEGFERLFREAGDAGTARRLERAVLVLERAGHDPQTLYVTAAVTGQQIEGHPLVRNANACVLADGEGRYLVTSLASLNQATEIGGGQVRLTALDAQQSQMDMEL
ncbi:Fic/DOC family protein [Deinococcus koreensis]|uniref:protein adenylyltransferase n=1 Tax=Deinococcus koreensis TaxID=2054903 RepID=A0A2K3URR8_9DEIO|nr:Fic family protein [Deinococcus koreensis]PNY79214.1 hypothetical protein CVO96_20065 [Deinococcus koreensis]